MKTFEEILGDGVWPEEIGSGIICVSRMAAIEAAKEYMNQFSPPIHIKKGVNNLKVSFNMGHVVIEPNDSSKPSGAIEVTKL